jgi:hypothetical protein
MTFASRLNEPLRMPPLHASAQSLVALLPRPFRFLTVGGLGLATNIVLFSSAWMLGVSLTAGLLAVFLATVLFAFAPRRVDAIGTAGSSGFVRS